MKNKDKVDPVQVLADRLIEQMKTNTAPWQKPWESSNPGHPYNAINIQPYRGYNNLALITSGYDDPRWLTFKQAQDLGCNVKKGEKGTPLMFYNFVEEKARRDESGQLVKDANGKTIKDKAQRERPIVRTFYVFNAEQIDGLPPLELRKVNVIEVNQRAEDLLKASGADINHKQGNRAYYSPMDDHIVLPLKEQFKSAEHYYSTALHELGHWSGHENRLNRELLNTFDSPDYAREELRAEISSMLVSQELGIRHDPSNHVAYTQHWIKALEDNPKEVLYAARDAQKIFEYVMQYDREYSQAKNTTAVIQPHEQEEELER